MARPAAAPTKTEQDGPARCLLNQNRTRNGSKGTKCTHRGCGWPRLVSAQSSRGRKMTQKQAHRRHGSDRPAPRWQNYLPRAPPPPRHLRPTLLNGINTPMFRHAFLQTGAVPTIFVICSSKIFAICSSKKNWYPFRTKSLFTAN